MAFQLATDWLVMNMSILERSKKAPQVGDIFTYLMPDKAYRYGRVIRADAEIAGFPDCLLLYFYSITSDDGTKWPELLVSDLLIPPVGTNRQAWIKGYFLTIKSAPLERSDVLPIHCFYCPLEKQYYNEYGKRLASKYIPCGDWGLHSYQTIDRAISEALGFEVYEADSDSSSEPSVRPACAWPKVPISIRNSDPKSQMRRLLKSLLNDLEEVAKGHGELYDTSVRERISGAILRAFVLDHGGYELPNDYTMFTEAGNRAVRNCLDRYIRAARIQALKEGLDTPAKRANAFEDIKVTSDEGQTFDDFFGASE